MCLLFTQQTLTAQAQTAFETKKKLKASSLLSPDLIKSNLYTIDESVPNDGLINKYTVRSIFGVFEVHSTRALKQLLNEIRAIDAMKMVETQNTVTQSVVQSGKNTVTAVSNLITEPQGTLQGAASGIGTLFNRTRKVIGRRQTTDAEDNKLEQVIGKSKSKGEIANKFGVNVYSMNPILQEELERLAWADYLGGLGIGLAQNSIPGAGGVLLTASGTTRLLNDVINTTPAAELWVRNEQKLLKMKMNQDSVQLYLNNPYFSPALQTVMVEALDSMKGVANRELFIKISLQANDYELARTITEIAAMTAGYHKNIAPLQSLSPIGRMLYATAKNGQAVVVFPADHILWTEKAFDISTWLIESKKNEEPTTTFQLWIFGDFSDKAQSALQSLGWDLHPEAQNKLFPGKEKS